MQYKPKDLTKEYEVLKDPSRARQPGQVYGMNGSDFSPHEYAQDTIDYELHRIAAIENYIQNQSNPPVGYSWKLIHDLDGYIKQVLTTPDFIKWTPDEAHPAYIKEYELEYKHYKSYDAKEGFKLWYKNINDPSLSNLFKLAYNFAISDIFPDSSKLVLEENKGFSLQLKDGPKK